MKKIILWLIGFILSPLSFWNDLFVNVPLSWFIASPVALVYRPSFPYAFAVAYIATNVLGMWMMDRAFHLKQKNGMTEWVNAIGGAGLLAAAALGWIPLPILFVTACVVINLIGAIIYRIAKNRKRVEQSMTLVYTALILGAVFMEWIPIPTP